MNPLPPIRRLANVSGATFALVFAWKIILLLFTAQPIPANDAFGYDGPVVNYLLHGHYCNPSLAIAFPFSGTNTYCAYPPGYQAALLPWMAAFGTSVLSAMWFHVTVFGLWLLALLAIFRRLQTPAWCVNLAGLFLFSITFDDRPDGLAQLLGTLAVYAGVRSLDDVKSKWPWLATALVVLAMATNPEVGGIYFAWVWLLALGAAWTGKRKFPFAPMIGLALLPPALIAAVKFGRPDLWNGFLEHATQTPSLTGWRLPHADELLKIIRTIPGTLCVAAVLLACGKNVRGAVTEYSPRVLMACAVFLSLGVTAGSLTVFAANWIMIANYLQPLAVGCFFALEDASEDSSRKGRWLAAAFVALALLASVRAIGMTTWGAACTADVNYARALKMVRAELDAAPANSTVVMSSAFLYEAARHPGVNAIHEDWMHRAGGGNDADTDTLALKTIRPREMILTQFDFYRRFPEPLARLRAEPALVDIKVVNAAKIPPPDAFKSWQRVLQHVSWAPVMVELDWKNPAAP